MSAGVDGASAPWHERGDRRGSGCGDRAPPLRVGPPQFCPFSSVVCALMNLVVVVDCDERATRCCCSGSGKAGRGGVGHSGVMGRLVSERSERGAKFIHHV